MEDHFIDYRGNTWGAARDIRARLKMARAGQVISFICSEDQTIRLLREITYYDGLVIRKENSAEGLHITVRKT